MKWSPSFHTLFIDTSALEMRSESCQQSKATHTTFVVEPEVEYVAAIHECASEA
jgi:hypothetical protein